MDSLIFQVLDKVSTGIIVVDRELKILIWNYWLQSFSGKTEEEVLGRYLTDICPRFKREAYLDMLHRALYHGQSRFCSSAIHQAFVFPKDIQNGDYVRQNIQIEPLYEDDTSYVLIQVSDMTNHYNRVSKLRSLIKEMEVEYNEIKTSEKISKHLALHDYLTGLPNRLLFNERLSWAISYAKRNNHMLAVMFLDIDGFKQVNDSFGHDAGDLVLKEAAQRLKGCVRNIDTVARMGGDEFTILLCQLKNKEDALIVAKKLVRVMEEPFAVNGHGVKLSASVGISLYPLHGQDNSELLKKADMAMYKVKASGKNGYRYI